MREYDLIEPVLQRPAALKDRRSRRSFLYELIISLYWARCGRPCCPNWEVVTSYAVSCMARISLYLSSPLDSFVIFYLTSSSAEPTACLVAALFSPVDECGLDAQRRGHPLIIPISG